MAKEAKVIYKSIKTINNFIKNTCMKNISSMAALAALLLVGCGQDTDVKFCWRRRGESHFQRVNQRKEFAGCIPCDWSDLG